MLGLSKRVALILLSLWLIATGLVAVADIHIVGVGLILNLLAIAAGALILLQAEDWSARIGMSLLGAWLAGTGLVAVVNVGVQGLGTVLNVVAIASGVLILLER